MRRRRRTSAGRRHSPATRRDVTGQPEAAGAERTATPQFTRELAEGVEEHSRRARPADRGPRDRLGRSTDRAARAAILRVALYEILHRPDVPDEVAIDEAVETAKTYCGARRPPS